MAFLSSGRFSFAPSYVNISRRQWEIDMGVSRAVFAIFAVLGSLLTAGAARAGDLAEFNAAFERVAAHVRVAQSYLRTGAPPLAQVEMDGAMSGWSAFSQRFAARRPDAFDGNALYDAAMAEGAARLAGAAAATDKGDAGTGLRELAAFSRSFADLRRGSGLYLLADCVRDANAAMKRLHVSGELFREGKGPAGVVVADGAMLSAIARQCDLRAPREIAAHPEFRRLIEGLDASGLEIGRRALAGDADAVHRYIGELLAFDNLLAFRFG